MGRVLNQWMKTTSAQRILDDKFREYAYKERFMLKLNREKERAMARDFTRPPPMDVGLSTIQIMYLLDLKYDEITASALYLVRNLKSKGILDRSLDGRKNRFVWQAYCWTAIWFKLVSCWEKGELPGRPSAWIYLYPIRNDETTVSIDLDSVLTVVRKRRNYFDDKKEK